MIFSESLKKNDDFRRLYRSGCSRANKIFVMYISRNGSDHNRLGVSVSKKVGNSVIRHRIARLVRESYRLNEEKFSSGLDIVVVARSAAAEARYKDVESAILHLAGLQHILINGQ